MIILQIKTYIAKQTIPYHTGGRNIWGGDYLVKAINNLDDDTAKSFVKTASKQDDEFFVLMSKYDDIPSWACPDVIDFNSAENVNEILKQNGYTNPPYKPGLM